MRQDLRHVFWVMVALVPATIVATLLTTGSARVTHAERIGTTIAALVRLDNREHAQAVDVSLDRRINLLESAAR
jgi:hypothetical protein